MNIIEKLKQNEKPFGLMSEEMCDAAKDIGVNEFIAWSDRVEWIQLPGGNDFSPVITYRLRPDYEEQPEIVECEVYKDSDSKSSWLCFKRTEIETKQLLHCAVNHPDFIGFEWDGILWGRLYKCKDTGEILTRIRKDRLHLYEVCDMTEAKVLFKKS